MKRLLSIIFFIIISINFQAEARYFNYSASCLTGGTTDCLDAINGQPLQDKDLAFVGSITIGGDYIYMMDSDSGLTEASPFVIKPDSNAGDKRWILVQQGNKYYVNYGAADQGADANDWSIKDIIDGEGSTKTATLVLRHWPEIGSKTTYTLTTSETITANYKIEIEPGAILDGAGTLTFAGGPSQIQADYRQQILGTSITLAWNSKKGTMSAGWFPIVADSTGVGVGTDNVAVFQQIDDSMASGIKLYIPAGGYNFDGSAASEADPVYVLTLNGLSDIEVFGDGDNTKLYLEFSTAQFRAGTDPNVISFRIFNITTCTNVRVHDLYFEGGSDGSETLPSSSAGAGAVQRSLPVLFLNSDKTEADHLTIKSIFGSGIDVWGNGAISTVGDIHDNYLYNILGDAINSQGGTEFIKHHDNIIVDCFVGIESASDDATFSDNMIIFTTAFTRTNYLGNITSVGIQSLGSEPIITGTKILADENIAAGIVVTGAATYLNDHPVISDFLISGPITYGIRVLNGADTATDGFNVGPGNITDIGTDPGESSYGIDIAGAASPDNIDYGMVHDVNIIGGSNSHFGIHIKNAEGVQIRNSSIVTTSYPIYQDTGTDNIDVIGNYLENTGGGIPIYGGGASWSGWKFRNNTGYNLDSFVFGAAGAQVADGTTNGKAKTTATVYYMIFGRRYTKAATDNLFDLTGVTTGAAEYKKVILCLDASGNGQIVEGTAAASQLAAAYPSVQPDYCPVGVVELGTSYSGGDLAANVFYDIIGKWPY